MKPRHAVLAILFAAAMQAQPQPALELTYLEYGRLFHYTMTRR